MARKTIVELLAEMNVLLADNTSGAITPEDLRTVIGDFIDTMTPAYAVLTTDAGVLKTFGVTDSLLTWTSVSIAQSPEYLADAATGKITRDQPVATNRISVNMDVELAANREILCTLYKNGAPTTWRAKASGSGTGRPAVLSLEALDYNAGPVEYQLYCQCDTAGTQVTVANAVFVASAIPVRTA